MQASHSYHPIPLPQHSFQRMQLLDGINLDDIICRARTHADVVFPDMRVKRNLIPVARMAAWRIVDLPRIMQQPLSVLRRPVRAADHLPAGPAGAPDRHARDAMLVLCIFCKKAPIV